MRFVGWAMCALRVMEVSAAEKGVYALLEDGAFAAQYSTVFRCAVLKNA
jgi:hypothetical protein